MAVPAHCVYCFEVLSANLERTTIPQLSEVELSWEHYQRSKTQLEDETHESGNVVANDLDSNEGRQASSSKPQPSSSPMFITWDTVTRSGGKRLRGCIGTFEAQELGQGLRTYALTSALEDTRFAPIDIRELSSLQCGVTLLTDFEPAPNPLAWDIGKHGLRISFSHQSRRYGSTYLPDVAPEQGWTKTETIISLMHKAGWRGNDADWQKVSNLNVTRYQGRRVTLSYQEWQDFRDWKKTASN